jgi:hypothetical protein
LNTDALIFGLHLDYSFNKITGLNHRMHWENSTCHFFLTRG